MRFFFTNHEKTRGLLTSYGKGGEELPIHSRMKCLKGVFLTARETLNILPTLTIREASRWTQTTTLKGICEVVPVLTMKVYGGSRGITPLILNLSTRWMWVVNFTHRPLYHRERTLISIEYEAWWTSGTVWMIWGRDQLCRCRKSIPGSPNCGIVTATTPIPTPTLQSLLYLQRIAQLCNLNDRTYT